MRKDITIPAILLILVAAAWYFNVVGLRQDLQRRNAEVSMLRSELDRLRKEGSGAQGVRSRITLYFIRQDPDEFVLVPAVREIDGVADARRVMEELIRGPGAGSQLLPVLPPGTNVRNTRVQDFVATVDLGEEVRTMNLGSRLELLTVAAIVNTLTKLPDVEAVRILVEGEPQETLAGHVDISGVLRRYDDAVKISD
ncbi:MAG: GerMN domain-containing protein [Bacillota bacterium]